MLTLDRLDYKLMHQLERNARRSLREIARTLKIGSDIVTYRFQRLKDRGLLLKTSAVIAPGALGLSVFKSYLNLTGTNTAVQRALKVAGAAAQTCWLVRMYGNWNTTHSIYASNASQYQQLFRNIFSGSVPLIRERRVSIITAQETLCRFTTDGPNGRVNSQFSCGSAPLPLDAVDTAIVGQVVEDGRASLVDIAGKIGSTPNVVKYRLDALEKQGVIAGYVPTWDIAGLDLLRFKVAVHLQGWVPQRTEQMLRWLKAQPSVVVIIQQLGAWELEFDVECRDLAALHMLSDEAAERFGDIIENMEYSLYREVLAERAARPLDKTSASTLHGVI